MGKGRRYPPRIPRFAAGIRAQGPRSAGQRVWWMRRWTAALESMHLGSRLGRGKNYAVSGQVTRLVIEGPHVTAEVVGSRPAPYVATLDFTAASDAAYARIASALKSEPMLLARLLVDDLPTEVEAIFRDAGVELFPTGGYSSGADGKRRYDITTRCSCPDYANPCKHLAAVFCLLGEEIARHPSTLLALRGVEIEELFDDAERVLRGKSAPASRGDEPAEAPQSEMASVNVTALVKRLGPIPFWRGSERCVERLSKIYERVAPTALKAASGSVDLRDESEKTRVTGVDIQLNTRVLSPST